MKTWYEGMEKSCIDMYGSGSNSPSSLLTKTIDVPNDLYFVVHALPSHDRHIMARTDGLSRKDLIEPFINSVPGTELAMV